MPPKKNKKKLEEQQDKKFEKSIKKQEETSKWLQVLEENKMQEEPQQVLVKKTPVFDFSNQMEYLKAEQQRLKRKEELLRMIDEAEEEIIDPEELENQQTDEEKAERLRKLEIIKERKRMKKERQRELRRIEVEEFEREKQQLRQQQSKEKKTANSSPKGLKWEVFLYIGIAIGLFYLFYYGQMYQRLSKFRVVGEDLYTILQSDSGLTDAELKAKYKKLVLKYHPDKNRDCHDCKEKFGRIVSAWEILGNAEKRQQYDASNGVITKIKSMSTTLTPQNYHHLVEESGELWIIQVYDSTSEYCHGYAPIWEEVVQLYKGFVRFGRIDAWHQHDMLSYVPYSFTVYPSVYSIHKGNSELYSFQLRNPLGSLKQFIDQQIRATAKQIIDQNFDLKEELEHGGMALIIPTERKYLPHQVRSIGQRYESTLKLFKVNPKTNKRFLDKIQLSNHLRLYFSADKYEDIGMPHSNEDYLSLDKRISRAAVRHMTICRLMDACSDVTCLVILNASKADLISNKHYPRVIVLDPDFHKELERMKRETGQLENFDLALYMDNKVSLGYAQDLEELTLDEGELIELKCLPTFSISWWRVFLGLGLLYVGQSLGTKEFKILLMIVGAVLIVGELSKYVEILYA